MSMYVLNNILVPPSLPNESGMGEVWPSIDERFSFPKDYIEFINVYGTGRVADFMVIFNPFSKNQNINFFEQKKIIIDDLGYLNNEDPEYFKYNLYPDINGLLPIGVTDNGDYIFWVVSDLENCNEWGTAIIASRSPDVEFFDENITSLLAGLLSTKITSGSLPKSFPLKKITFEKM
ncbi:SMI1/KNR4 family protein [Aeromonas salmonicida]|uniref:SMI1/KNR4 family protein n=1 Tax=Aeromonas salmonicida TaxID=645 RepID=UPI000F794AEE|nr:SMI1/KNR4 family protein [Aeromonas salmonicida]RSM26375.1 SMI1/KNR4 family protein [Aeromonas salmonicida]